MNLQKWLRDEATQDLAIGKVISQGEKEKKTKLEVFEALLKMVLNRNAFLFIELGKYRNLYGDLPEDKSEDAQAPSGN